MVGIFSLIFGIAGVLTSFFYIGIFLCIVGITLGIVGLADCFSEKNFPLAGLLVSILGVVLSVYVVVADVDSNKLIVIYNSEDKIYLSNYKKVMATFDELESNSFEHSENILADVKISSIDMEQTTDTNIVADEPLILYQPVENQIQEPYESVAIQPDKDWYLSGCKERDESEENYQQPAIEQQSEQENEIPEFLTNDIDDGINSVEQIEVTYVLNHNTMKFHKPDCYSASTIKEENREDTTLSREEVIELGYVACQKCKP